MIIFLILKTSRPTSIKNKKVTNIYFTKFEDNDIYYDIESTNANFKDFKYILDKVIELFTNFT